MQPKGLRRPAQRDNSSPGSSHLWLAILYSRLDGTGNRDGDSFTRRETGEVKCWSVSLKRSRWFHYAVALLILDQLYGRSWVRRRSRISDCAGTSVNIWTWCKCRWVQSANASGSAVAARVSVGQRNGIQETGRSLREAFLWSRRPISLSLSSCHYGKTDKLLASGNKRDATKQNEGEQNWKMFITKENERNYQDTPDVTGELRTKSCSDVDKQGKQSTIFFDTEEPEWQWNVELMLIQTSAGLSAPTTTRSFCKKRVAAAANKENKPHD